MIVHFNQPRFLPALNYFQRMIMADVFSYRDDVQFQPKCWENRNKIKCSGGWMWLSVPVREHRLGQPICETCIDNSLPWARKMIAAIRCNYGKAPYFGEWFPRFENVLNHRFERLTAMNLCIIDLFIEAWKIECKFVMASSLECEGDTDGILIDMCKKLGADTYLSGSEGRNYNRPEAWRAAGIDLRYHDYDPVPYPQQFGEFMPWVSALDLLMNCGADGRDVLTDMSKAKAA